MTLSEKLFNVCVIISAVALGLAFALGGQALWSPVFVVVGALWIAGQRYEKAWSATVGLLCCIAGAVLGFWSGLPGGLLLLGAVAALAAWDLHNFTRRLQDVESAPDVQALERPHLTRLGAVSGLGLLFGALALTIRVNLGFGVVFALGLVAVVGLSRLVRET